VQYPNSIPVDVYLQEAENLYHWAVEDENELRARGLDWNLVTDIPARAGAVRAAESRWITTRFAREEAEAEWANRSPAAYDLRDELVQTFRFTFRKSPDLLGRVAAIAEGYSNADMIQDLNDLATLGRQHTAELQAIQLDLAVLDKAAKTADEMADLLGLATSERAETGEAIDLRNRAYSHLKEAVDEIRAYGQFVFRHDDKRAFGYSSVYRRRVRRRSSGKNDEQVMNPST